MTCIWVIEDILELDSGGDHVEVCVWGGPKRCRTGGRIPPSLKEVHGLKREGIRHRPEGDLLYGANKSHDRPPIHSLALPLSTAEPAFNSIRGEKKTVRTPANWPSKNPKGLSHTNWGKGHLPPI